MNAISPLRVLICGHDLKFVQPLVKFLESSSDHELRILTHSGHYLRDHSAAEDALNWADVVFCEWALDNAVWFSHRKREDQILIVRLHAQEVRDRDRIDFIYAIDWQRVDRLILITHHLFDWMKREFPVLAAKSALVFNPIPAASWRDLSKPPEARFVLGLVGMVPAIKRLDLAVAVLRHLRQADIRYCLRVKGALPSEYPWMASRTREMAWYEELFEEVADLRADGALVFDPHGPDMAQWYQGVGHILSVSDSEGSHQAVAEGMAAGCIPVIRDWVGAERIYPSHYVGRSVDDLVGLVLRHTDRTVFEKESEFCRSFATSHFDEATVCDALLSIIYQEVRRRRPRGIVQSGRPCSRPTFLVLAYVPIHAHSGYRIRVEQEIQILAQLGCIVHLACLVPPQTLAADQREMQRLHEAHAAEFASMGARVHVVEIEDFFRLHVDADSFPETVNALVDLVKEWEVDILHAEALYCARVGALVKARAPGLHLTIDWHGVAPEEAQLGGAHEKRVQALESAERKLLETADLNIFVSRAMARHYWRKYEIRNLKDVIVPCCVSDQRFTEIEASFNWKWEGDSLIFAYAGSMADWQCGQEMIRLFSALERTDAKCRFVLLVPTPDHERVLTHARDVGLPPEKFVLQSVAHHEVPARLAGAHVGVLLRRSSPVNEVSSPTKFGEYLAAGLPVIMTDGIGDFTDLAAREGVGLVIPHSILDAVFCGDMQPWLARIIAFAQWSRSRRREVSLQCQRLARDHLQWERAALSWLRACVNMGV